MTSRKWRFGYTFHGAELARVLCSLLALGALVYVISSLFVSAFLEPWQHSSFPMLGSFRMFPPFADLRWITALSECGHDLSAIAAGKDPGCDPYGRTGGLGYPPFSIYSARALGLGLRQTGIIAFGFGLILLLLLVAQMRRLICSGWIRDLLLSLLLLGFPLQLALERANLDLIIYIFITAICALIALPARWTLPFVGLFSLLPVACKVYPVIGLFAWVFQDWLLWRRVRPKALMVLIGASLGMLSALSWLLLYGSKAPDPGEGVMAHGFMTSTLFWISQQLSNQWANWPAPLNAISLISIKITVITISFLVAINHNFSGLWRQFLSSRCQGYVKDFLGIYVFVMTATWLGCYLFSSSFDYRLIFSFPALIACIALVTSPLVAGKSLRFLFKLFIFALPLIFLPSLFLTEHAIKSRFIPVGVVDSLVPIADYLALPLIAGVLMGLIFPSRWGGEHYG